jgi:sec-independent protein translocase protein TatA
MPNLGPTELIIILIIVVVLFGGGRIAKLGGELGSAIKEFRKGVGAEDKAKSDAATLERLAEDKPKHQQSQL